MDEYFCPNCGAILNNQYGFDPDNGAWTCTECGMQLMDDDTYEGDTFEGVAWYCDSCGALLNKQSGFSDSYGTWTCTECYHTNPINEDEIINNDNNHICPNCNAILDKQWCYADYEDDWECTECGAHLHHSYSDDPYEIVEDDEEDDDSIECPNCGSNLENQSGYSDYEDRWECEECGSFLYRRYSDDPYEVLEKGKDTCPNCDAVLDEQSCYGDYLNEWTCEECGVHLKREYTCDEYEVVEDDSDKTSSYSNSDDHYDYSEKNYDDTETTNRYQNIYKTKTTDKKSRKELFFKRLKATVFGRGKISLDKSVNELIGRDVENVKVQLENMGFNNIKAIAVPDIYVGSTKKVGEVEQVVIDGQSWFEIDEKKSFSAEVIVTYHIKRQIKFPYAIRSLKGKNYEKIADELSELGFTEIYTNTVTDLLTGWIKKDGSIEEVRIENEESVRKGIVLNYDTKIVITYHTFKKNS